MASTSSAKAASKTKTTTVVSPEKLTAAQSEQKPKKTPSDSALTGKKAAARKKPLKGDLTKWDKDQLVAELTRRKQVVAADATQEMLAEQLQQLIKKHCDNMKRRQARAIPRLDELRSKKGEKQAGTEACHIVSFEIVNDILKWIIENKEEKPSVREILLLAYALNDDSNLRIKSSAGNRAIKKEDGSLKIRYHDRELDAMIMDAARHGKVLTVRKAEERMFRQVRLL